jgi:hypothetical protein
VTFQGGIDVDAMIYCLVDRHGNVFTTAGASSFEEAARELGVNERECQEYRYDLAARRLLADRATPSSALAVQDAVNRQVGNPERLMTFAGGGHMPKLMLLNLLSGDQRQAYLEACSRIERQYTNACMSNPVNCLATGCSVRGTDEICLAPLMHAGIEYQKACAAEWIKLFLAPAHRVDAWKH